MKKIHILLVDDEQDLVWAIRRHLDDEGYDVSIAYDGMEALASIRRRRPDLIILDIIMPRLDGLQVCSSLRRDSQFAAVPILLLTSSNTIEDRIKGLDEGADDYVIKPFDMRELKARIRALLRRSHLILQQNEFAATHSALLTVGGITLNLHTCQAQHEERVIQLTPAEFDLLHYLMIHPDEVFSSHHLLQQVWGYTPETANPGLVRWHIMNLRAKLEPNPDRPLHIRTIPRHGYIFRS